MEFLYSIYLSFKNIGNDEIKKLSIINGIFWIIIWLIISFFCWNKMLYFTSLLLTIFPFSFIQLSGAQIIFTLLWIQSIFITIGILFTLFNEIIEKKLEKTHFHYLSITIGFIIILFWSYIFFSNETSIENYILHIIKILPFQTVQELISSLLAILFFYLLYCATMSMSFILFAIPKLKKITTAEYPEITLNKISYVKLFWIFFRDLIIYIFLAIILYPFMIIPWINILTLAFLWTYVIKDSYSHIIQSLFNVNITKKEKWILSFISIFLDFLPIINIFAPAFGILLFYHYSLEKKFNNLEK